MNKNPIHLLISDIQSISLYLVKVLTSAIKKYWWLNTIVAIICCLAMFIKLNQTKIYYKATAAFDYNFFYKKMYGDNLLDLKNLIYEKKYDEIAKQLKIPTEASTSLIDIHAYNIFGTDLHEDFTQAKLTFYIDIKSQNSRNSAVLLNGLLHFMNNVPLAEQKIKELQTQKNNELLILNKELEILNEIINTSSVPKNTSEDLSQFFRVYEDKNHRKTEVQKTLNVKECITLVKEFNFSEVSKMDQLKPFFIKVSLLLVFSLLIMSPFIYILKDYKTND